jgi:hypothetical protein
VPKTPKTPQKPGNPPGGGAKGSSGALKPPAEQLQRELCDDERQHVDGGQAPGLVLIRQVGQNKLQVLLQALGPQREVQQELQQDLQRCARMGLSIRPFVRPSCTATHFTRAPCGIDRVQGWGFRLVKLKLKLPIPCGTETLPQNALGWARH